MGERTRIGIIDCYPRYLSGDRVHRLQTILGNPCLGVELLVEHFSRFDPRAAREMNGIVITGSSLNVSDFYYQRRLAEKFSPIEEFLRENESVPVLGICFGHHLVAHAFGVHVCRMAIRGPEVLFLSILPEDELVADTNPPVNVFHRDYICPNDAVLREYFDLLATSRSCDYPVVQYMRHVDKPIYAVQFHPETHDPYYFLDSFIPTPIVDRMLKAGEDILRNFARLCSKTLTREKTTATDENADGD